MKKFSALLLFLPFITLFNSCKESTPPESSKNKQILKDTLIAGDNVFVVDTVCAVNYSPDSVEIAKMQSEDDEETFTTMMDDVAAYQYEIIQLLEKNNIRTKFTNKRYIVFKKANGEKKTVDTKALEEDFGFILFVPSKDPQGVQFIDADSVIVDYFK